MQPRIWRWLKPVCPTRTRRSIPIGRALVEARRTLVGVRPRFVWRRCPWACRPGRTGSKSERRRERRELAHGKRTRTATFPALASHLTPARESLEREDRPGASRQSARAYTSERGAKGGASARKCVKELVVG